MAREYFQDTNGLVLFFDEGRFGLQPHIGRMWALRGKRLRATLKTGYQNFYLYAAVDPRSGQSFILELPWVNAEMINIFLEQLGASFASQNLLLIWDRAGYHRAKSLKVPQNIRIEPLPAYSPELNPVEHLWQWLRRHVCRNRLYSSLEQLEKALCRTIQRMTPEHLSTLCRCEYILQKN